MAKKKRRSIEFLLEILYESEQLVACVAIWCVYRLSFDEHKRCTSINSIEMKEERKKKISRAHTSQLDWISHSFIESKSFESI